MNDRLAQAKDDRDRFYRSAAAQGKEISIAGEGLSFPKKTPLDIERGRRHLRYANNPQLHPKSNDVRLQIATAIPYCYREPHDRDAVIIHVAEGSILCNYITESVGIYYNSEGEITGGRVDKAQDILDIINRWWSEFNGVFEVGYLLWSHAFKAKDNGSIEDLNALARKCRDAKLTVNHKPTEMEMIFGHRKLSPEEAEQALKKNVDYFNNLNRVPNDVALVEKDTQ